MNVFLFRADTGGQAIVAADNAFEAWDALVRDLPGADAACFSPERCEQILSLTSLHTGAAVITYNC